MIEIENRGNIRTIILNRPKKLNAINLEMATSVSYTHLTLPTNREV